MIIDLAVIYTTQLDACHEFYSGLGLDFVPEQHGTGPAHYAATLAGGGVLELYPADTRPATGHLRIGFTAPAAARHLPTGRHVLTDPDGRTVVVTMPEENTTMTTTEQTARDAVRRILGDDVHVDVTAFPDGNLSLTVTAGEHMAAIEGHDRTGWGWSVDPRDDEAFTGHDQVAPTLTDALAGVRDKIRP